MELISLDSLIIKNGLDTAHPPFLYKLLTQSVREEADLSTLTQISNF